MEKQERIVCAAIEIRVFNNVVEMCETVIVPCIRHDDGDPSVTIDKLNPLLAQMWTLGRLDVLSKGFITNHNRFVDPIEAQKIAIAAGQYECPNRAIKSLEEAIENRWFEINHTRNNMVFQTLKNYNRRDKEKIQQLKAGYLGYELRVEDLY